MTAAAKQDRVFGAESPTDGYTTFKLFGAYSWQARQAVHTVTARLENVANERYFNHLSYIKDFVPEMGRSLKLVYHFASRQDGAGAVWDRPRFSATSDREKVVSRPPARHG